MLQGPDGPAAATRVVARYQRMCGLRGSAGSAAEMSDVHCGVSDFVDGGQYCDARRDALAHDGGDFVRGLGVFAALPVGRGTDPFGERGGE